MSVKIIVPSLGESVTAATIAKWYKKEGDSVKTDELLLEIETEKVTLEVNAPCNGAIGKISKTDGANVAVGEEIGEINEGAAANTAGTNNESAKAQAVTQPTSEKPVEKPAVANNTLAPSVQKLVTENKLDPNN